MQMIPILAKGPDTRLGQVPRSASTTAHDVGPGTGFPELLNAAASSQTHGQAAATVQAQKTGSAAPEFAAEESVLMADFEALWGNLSQLAVDAQNAFQSATSTSAKVEVMENFIADFHTRIDGFRSTSVTAIAPLAGQLGYELAQDKILSIGVGDAAFATPIQVFDKGMAVLQSLLPTALHANASTVSMSPVEQATSGPVEAQTTASANAASALSRDAQTTAIQALAPVPQTSKAGTVQPASLTSHSIPVAPVEGGVSNAAAPDARALWQGEDIFRAVSTETSKAALKTVAVAADGGKLAGHGASIMQAIAPSAPPTAVPEAAQTLSVDLPAGNTARTSAELAPAFSFARNVAAQVRGTVFEEGKTRVELTPRGLGDIEVEVARDDSGKLRVVLRAENVAVLTAFRNDREMIIGILRESGIAVNDGEVAFESFDGHQSSQDRGRSSSNESVAPLSTLMEEDPTDANVRRPSEIRPTGTLDITT